MTKRNLCLVGIMSLSLIAISGCAEKMAKSDDAAAPTMAQPTQAEGDAQATSPATDNATPPAADAAGALPTPLAEAAATAPAAPDNAAAEKQAAAALLPLPPEEVTSTIKKLTTHPRVRYLSRSAQYSYFVGGVIDAEYDVNNNELVLTDPSNSDIATCKYSKDGKLVSDKKKIPAKTIADCNNLMNELTGFLSR